MSKWILAWVMTLGLLGLAAPAQPVQLPGNGVAKRVTADPHQQAMLRNMQNTISQMPEAMPAKSGEILSLRLVKGNLDVDPGAYDYTPGSSRVTVEGCPATWVVTTNLQGRNPIWNGRNEQFFVTRYDWDQNKPGQFWNTSIRIGTPITIEAQGIDCYLSLAQRENEITLTIADQTDNSVVSLVATSLVQLEVEHPQEMRKYLAPLLIRLAGHDILRPSPADLYVIFPDIQPDAGTVKGLNDLLTLLDADDFATRQKASAQLANLGPQGCLAAMRLDLDKLSIEQKIRITNFLATTRSWSFSDPAALRKDPDFLFLALDADDSSVAAAAKKALESLLGHAIELDLLLKPADRPAAINALRASLQKELDARRPSPSTRPAPTVPVVPVPYNGPAAN